MMDETSPTADDFTPPLDLTPPGGGGGGGSSDLIMGAGSGGFGEGDRIGPYRIVRQLGEGGMGVVYLAERSEPIRQVVALKLILGDANSDAVLQRFEMERRILERMDHHSIAKILDAGTTDDGRPYFVMEYVKGDHITRHCRRHKLTLEERLELLIQVAEAVQHAHHKGVIHRDLKPSNILVSWEGNRASPKIIDFGVARATDPNLRATSEAAELGKLLGTVEYMSPEQAEMSAEDIDTRTDVYSLGVVLYELLTDSLPFPSDMLRNAGREEMLRIIREEYPPLPSERLSPRSTAGTRTDSTVADTMKTRARRLSGVLREELDWVVTKCMEKRRDRRYATPSEFALQLRKFLNGEALDRPNRFGYLLRKFIAQHKPQMATIGVLGLAVVAGLAATTLMWQRAQRAESNTRELAHEIFGKFHDEALSLPGSVRVRDTFVGFGLSHLEEMRERGGNSAELLLELADGHDLLGAVAAGLRTPHRGDLEEGARQFEIAASLRREVIERRPDDARALIGLATSAMNLGDLERQAERHEQSIELYERGLESLDRLGEADARTAAAQLSRANLLVVISQARGRDVLLDDRDERQRLLREAERITDRLMAGEPDDDVRQARARTLENLGAWHLSAGAPDFPQAVRLLDEAASLRGFLFSEQKTNAVYRRALAWTLVRRGMALAGVGDKAEARRSLDQAVAHFEFLVEADPEDVESRERLSQALETLAMSTNIEKGLPRAELLVRAVELSQEAISLGVEISPEDVIRVQEQRRGLARQYRFAVSEETPTPEALSSYSTSLEMASEVYEGYERLLRDDPKSVELLERVALVSGDAYEALRRLQRRDSDGELTGRWLRTWSDATSSTLEWADAQGRFDRDAEAFAGAMERLRGYHTWFQRWAALTSPQAASDP